MDGDVHTEGKIVVGTQSWGLEICDAVPVVLLDSGMQDVRMRMGYVDGSRACTELEVSIRDINGHCLTSLFKPSRFSQQSIRTIIFPAPSNTHITQLQGRTPHPPSPQNESSKTTKPRDIPEFPDPNPNTVTLSPNVSLAHWHKAVLGLSMICRRT